MRALSKHQTFGAILDKNRGAGKGFDLLRLGLALLILVSHMSSIVGHGGTTAWITSLIFGSEPSVPAAAAHVATQTKTVLMPQNGFPRTPGLNGISGPFIRALVPMFFALSGFLVAGSALRTSKLVPFLGLRVLRIVPALFVEVFLSAIVLGAIFTTLPLSSYFSHPQFAAYFLNIIGVIHFYLPGVFQNNHDSVVNANLWTLPFELECYLVMSAFIVFGLLRNRVVFTAAFLCVTIILIIANVGYGYSATMDIFTGRVLIYYFTCGVLLFVWRDKIPFSYLGLVLSLIISYFLLRLTNATFITPLFLTYATASIGLANLPQFKILKTGDYSYGIYLYSFPVSQAVVATIGADRLPYVVMVALVIVLTCLFAAFSWHGIEKHFLKLKRFISKSSAKITEDLQPTVGQASDISRLSN